MTYGASITVIPMVYQTILRKAHQRTFNLQRRLKEAQPAESSDPEVDAVVQQRAKPLFEGRPRS